MSTVPQADMPPPADNHITYTLESNSQELYSRLTAGGNASGNAGDAPAGVIPSNPVVGGISSAPPDGSLSALYKDGGYQEANAGQPASIGGTQVGPDIGSGSTIVQPDMGNVESGLPDAQAQGGGTVGDSGPQL